MANRIEVVPKIDDARAEVKKKKIQSMGFDVDAVSLADVYTIDASLDNSSLNDSAAMFSNPVTQEVGINTPKAPEKFNWAIETGFLPGVTDNVGQHTAKEMLEDHFKTKLDGEVYSSQVMFLSGNLTKEDALKIGDSFSNPIINRISIKSYEEFVRGNGMDVVVPRVKLGSAPVADLVDIINASDNELSVIGKQGIANSDGTRRGPLSMDLLYMKAIQAHFRELGRNPSDVEVESIAQTWSEHCKHTIFANPIDEIKDGLFNHYVKRATEEIRRKKGDKDFCVSVFVDNAGGIIFDDKYLVCHKIETHNTPSALDPFGGAITGIVGVNRDPRGFGLGAEPFANVYGFCFGNPDDTIAIYKGANKTQKMLSPIRIMEGVIEGVNVGGNCSGIPTTQGFLYFDDSYKGKPLVYVGTLGLIPIEINGKKSHEKKAMHGDYIVMLGGRVGKDGIHGATFSSEAIDSGSPVTAVQIGDPITQKKMGDALIEARDLGLYKSLTDNGAGGLSCSVAEMAKESGGCRVELEKVPLKYPGLAPYEIWISEAQERMTVDVPKENWNDFYNLMKRRGVEATRIGEFTDSGNCIVTYNETTVMDIDMDFLHNGLPQKHQQTTFTRKQHEEPEFKCLDDLTETLHSMLARKNIASFEFISQQYDHEVQGGSVIKPLQGRGRVNGSATIIRPRLDSDRAVVISHGINPSYSEIDTYDMAASAVDTAVRRAVAAGADLDCLAVLDNFCWCSSNEPERLGQLKRACTGFYDTVTVYGTPPISGKDSMFNDFIGFDEFGNPIKISVLPTLLVSTLGVIKDAKKAISTGTIEGDLVYVFGTTNNELGGSEYFAMVGEKERGKKYIGNNVPQVNAHKNNELYRAFSKAGDEELVASAISVDMGGLGIALAKSSISGQLGLEVDLTNMSNTCQRSDFSLFSESQGRLVVTVNPEYQERFEEIMGQNTYALVGKVRADNKFIIKEGGRNIVDTTVDKLTESYKSTFQDF